MTSIGIIANSDVTTIAEALTLLKQLPNFKIIFVKQSNIERLYVVSESVFNVVSKDVNGDVYK